MALSIKKIEKIAAGGHIANQDWQLWKNRNQAEVARMIDLYNVRYGRSLLPTYVDRPTVAAPVQTEEMLPTATQAIQPKGMAAMRQINQNVILQPAATNQDQVRQLGIAGAGSALTKPAGSTLTTPPSKAQQEANMRAMRNSGAVDNSNPNDPRSAAYREMMANAGMSDYNPNAQQPIKKPQKGVGAMRPPAAQVDPNNPASAAYRMRQADLGLNTPAAALNPNNPAFMAAARGGNNPFQLSAMNNAALNMGQRTVLPWGFASAPSEPVTPNVINPNLHPVNPANITDDNFVNTFFGDNPFNGALAPRELAPRKDKQFSRRRRYDHNDVPGVPEAYTPNPDIRAQKYALGGYDPRDNPNFWRSGMHYDPTTGTFKPNSIYYTEELPPPEETLPIFNPGYGARRPFKFHRGRSGGGGYQNWYNKLLNWNV